MTTSNYMPDVQVEIAFDSGVTTAPASRTWTDVSAYVELADGISITRGRQDERSTCDANRLSLTLDNSDGRFTAGYASGAYYPNVKIGRPIRVKATHNSVTYTRFVGFIDEWPVEWDGSDVYAKAKVTATSRLARLGTQVELPNIIAAEYGLHSPAHLWDMGDPAGSTEALDSSGNGGPSLQVQAGVTFGSATGPGTDGITAASLSNGWLSTNQLSPITSTFSLSLFLRSTNTTRAIFDADGSSDATLVGWSAIIDASGNVTVTDGTNVLNGSVAVNDDATHHVAITNDGVTMRLYVDGVADGTNTGIAPTAFINNTIRVGRSFNITGYSPVFLTGTVAQVALFSSVIGATSIADISDAGLNGFAGDTTGARIQRYADYAGVPSTEESFATGNTTMIHLDTTGQTALGMMRICETTEGGVLFDAADGTLTFADRAARYTATVELTLDVGAHEVEVGITPKLDRSSLQNDVTVSVGGTEKATQSDATSIAAYGYARTGIDSATEDADEPRQRAAWEVTSYSEPLPRIPELSFDILPMSTARIAAALSLEVNSRIQVTNLPAQAEATTKDFFIEGITEAIRPESWFITANVSPASIYEVLTLGDATYGALGSYPLAY